MRKAIAGIAALGLGVSLVAATAVQPAGAAPPPGAQPGGEPAAASPHELPNPLESKRRELRQEALTQVINGEVTPTESDGSTVVQVGEQPGASDGEGWLGGSERRKSQYVELARETTDRVFVLLVEFGDERHPDYPDQDTDPDTPGPARFDGPRRNEIPEPDRTVDNSTIWQPDSSPEYFQNLYFGTGDGVESMKTYYEKQSSGRYSIDGQATAWVTVPFNEARYGRSNGFPCDDIVCDNTWHLVRDGLDQWVADQQAAGVSDADIAAELASYDVWDRYDHDGDGDFNEPDGYIDHMQIVHAGGDQADGDPHQGEDAIWSHRWYAFVSDAGLTGPAGNPLGGTEIGDTGIWAGDYTVQPENGGLSTIAHEYGHDLGLPDHYDTAGGQNGVEWWTLMAQSRLSAAGEPIGTRAGDLSAWDKLQLGWLDFEVTRAGETKTIELGPHEYNTRRPQALVTVLPPKTVTFDYGTPFAGDRFWWSTKGDDLTTSMARDVDLTGAATAALDLEARFEIEAGFDYLYVQASTDGGATWTSLDGTVGGEPFVRDGSDSPAISGSSGGEWLHVNIPLDAYAGAPVAVRLLYRTDGGVAPDGFFADEIVVSADGAPVATSGAETDDEGWALDGFRPTTGNETGDFDNYYIASHRSYVSFDRYLKTGPYNFGFLDSKPDWVEHFKYQQGLLVSYWDTSQTDNNTSEHPGQGEVLVIDAHPQPIVNPLTGAPWRSRIQVYDAPFSLSRASSFELHVNSQPARIVGRPAQPTFDDSNQYWFAEMPNVGVKVPDTGTRLTVTRIRGTTLTVSQTAG
ncbi:MAG TPA: immune inhibitor A domain-containing protein [Acidimicrobiales bacterium]|nr:immune inhibitor A domain-containing protein [Acidimicrobiales bacterium]